jgi:hypothetical protein
MKTITLLALLSAAPAVAQPALAQEDHAGHAMTPAADHATMDHAAMGHGAMGHGAMDHGAMHGLLGGYAMSREASGTSWQPQAAPHDAIHLSADDWAMMLHGRVTAVADSQSGPRGDSQIFSSSMVMGMATRDLGNGDTLGLKAMLSGDPFMGRRGYPLLLAAGETADGISHLVDRQHPHDLLMELAATYSKPLSASDSLFLYAGYPGEPALGPSAYMHRASAVDNPATPLSHHWLDSTHITFGVVTAGWVHDRWKLEVSQFTGREPDQHRFNFDKARFDSSSARISFNPTEHWSLQVSAGWLKSPEGLEPDENERRLTASASYYRQFDFGAVAATLAVGNKHMSDGHDTSAFLLEAQYKPDDAWTVFTRAESIRSAELIPEPGPRSAGQATLGLTHDWRLSDNWKFGVGALHAFAFAPGSRIAPYGDSPRGTMGFVRLIAE